jgi:hypothetical protein
MRVLRHHLELVIEAANTLPAEKRPLFLERVNDSPGAVRRPPHRRRAYALFSGLLSSPPQKFLRAHASPAMLSVVASFLLRVAVAKGMTASERRDLLATLRDELSGVEQENADAPAAVRTAPPIAKSGRAAP